MKDLNENFVELNNKCLKLKSDNLTLNQEIRNLKYETVKLNVNID